MGNLEMETQENNLTADEQFEQEFQAAAETATNEEPVEGEPTETYAEGEPTEEPLDEGPSEVDLLQQQLQEMQAKLEESNRARVEQQQKILERLADKAVGDGPKEKGLKDILWEKFDDDTARRMEAVTSKLVTKNELNEMREMMSQMQAFATQMGIRSADQEVIGTLRQTGLDDAAVREITEIKDRLMAEGNRFSSARVAFNAAKAEWDQTRSKKTAGRTQQARANKTANRSAASMPSHTRSVSGGPKLTKEQINEISQLDDEDFWSAVQDAGLLNNEE